ncbi:MAG: hypothetical protein J6I70_07485 [Bacteroidaceae bacterium]|nr:hypothetical protein [Bacteroidaceae bacterium]
MQKVFLILFVGTLTVLVGHKTMKSSIVMNDVILKNMEALAEGESGVPVTCDWSGEVTCPNNGDKVGVVYQGYSLRP